MATTIKLFADKMGGTSAESYIGVQGDLFCDTTYGGLRLGNGQHPGGIQLGLETIPSLVDPAYENHQNALSGWKNFVSQIKEEYATNPGINETGWSWLKWNVTGESASGYLDELATAWQVQQAPTSPPSQLIFTPPITVALYQQMRNALIYVSGSYSLYLEALGAKQISGVSLTLPEIVQTTADEDLVLRVRTSLVTSPPGGTAYSNRDFTLSVNGTLIFPNGTVQTGASISKADLQFIVESSADFAAFKAAIAAL
jgi:hypothetical protein